MSKKNRYPGQSYRIEPTEVVGKIFKLPSGFTIRVRPLAPYYLDIINDAIPMPEYPQREVLLMAGDTVYLEYTPSEPPPVVGEDDYDLYLRWLNVDQLRNKLEAIRKRAKRDYLLATCVDILSGPIDYEGDGWVHDMEAAFEGYTIPDHPGARKLAFLKGFVVASAEWMDVILQAAVAEEADMQGIITALRGFQYKNPKRQADRHNSQNRQQSSKL